jgi:hypothetical protein
LIMVACWLRWFQVHPVIRFLGQLLLKFEKVDASHHALAWYARVPSLSNLGDGPPRGEWNISMSFNTLETTLHAFSLELLWNQRSHVLVTGSRRCAMSIMGTKVSRSVIGAERWPTDMIGDKLQHEAAKMDLYPVCPLSAWKGCVVRSRALSFIWLDFFCESLGCTRSAAVFPFCWLLFTRFGDVTWKWMTSKWRSRFVFLTHYMECLICG